jgi:hypothetical protein
LRRSFLPQAAEQLSAHDHFESAARQLRKSNAGILECFVDADLRQKSGSDGRLFESINCALSHTRLPAEVGLAPTQYCPGGPHSRGKEESVRLAA